MSLLVSALWLIAHVESAEPIALKARVTDTAQMLRPSTVQVIEQLSETLERKNRVQLAVLTVPNLGGRSVEEFALKTAELSGLGQKKIDNGVLLLVSQEERAIRIEVGYGLEGLMTDLVSSRIIRGLIVPEFRQGRFDEGIVRGVQAILARVEDPNSPLPAPERRRRRDAPPWAIVTIIILIAVFGQIAERLGFTPRRRRSGWWGGGGGGFGGSGGGGFGGFSGGGGGFGGGGASGRW